MEKQEETDNKRTDLVDESANGLDSVEVRGGQNGRNSRGIGSNDMDAKNGILRLGDQDDSTMQVTEKGANAAVSQEEKEEDVSQSGTSVDHQPTY